MTSISRRSLETHRHPVRAAAAVATLAWPMAAGAGTGFTEEAIERGINYTFEEFTVTSRYGCGVAFLDLDNDGDPDVVTLGGSSGRLGLFENDGNGFFADRTGAAPSMPEASGISAADYDGDGDVDLFVSHWYASHRLLRNDGGFSFVDVTTAAGVGGAGDSAGTGCAWADYDNDGRLDLYVSYRTWDADPSAGNHLFRNLGGGIFTDVGTDLEVDDGPSPTFQAVFFDLGGDGDADLYISTDKGYQTGVQNRLFENNGGVFTDVTAATETAANINSMGVAVGDFDGNLRQDLYCTNTTQGNVLYLGQPGSDFQQAQGSGCGSFLIGWGALFLDIDNDGHQELYACNELGTTGTPNAPNRLYDHDGTWPAVDRAADLGVNDMQRSFGSAAADLEDDGDLDLLVQDNDRIRLYINPGDDTRHWVKFNVSGVDDNRFAVGAVVTTRVGATMRMREVTAGGSYKSQNHRVLHFGLADATMIDQVVVRWPGGATRLLLDLPVDRTWTLYPDEQLGDADRDGAWTFDDFVVLRGCVEAASLEPGCEVMDLDGDGTVDLADGLAFLERYEDPVHDCDGNRQGDLLDILEGTVADEDGDGIPDACEAVGDVNGDGAIGIDDVVLVVLNWGPCPDPPDPCIGDADGNGTVSIDDLVIVVLNWTG